MARVLAVHSEALPYRIDQAVVREAVSRWLADDLPLRKKLIDAYAHGGIQSRFSVLPFERIFDPPGFTERNRVYGEVMVEFGTRAVARTLALGEWPPERVHTIVVVSCTGVMIPSPDVHIVNRLKLLPSVRRIPVTELGCVAGAVALARGAEVVDLHPRVSTAPRELQAADLAVILAAEFPSLNFQVEDQSPANVISSSLFGDAVVALVLGPDEEPGPAPAFRASSPAPGLGGPRVVAARSHVIPDSTDLLGYDLRETGFHIVLSREVPLLLKRVLPGLIEEFLRDVGWSLSGVRRWIFHPGGERIIDACLEGLGLPQSCGDMSRAVLHERGNASSAAVLLILERLKEEALSGDRGLLMAFGPGLSTELVALEW
jgi:alkylresorcinol/alkylpyrone synthase